MNSIVGFFVTWLLKLISKLPSSQFDYATSIRALDDILGYVNWFIPFYTFYNIILAWIGIVFTCAMILLVIRMVIRAKVGG